jgi:hypothetical protein
MTVGELKAALGDANDSDEIHLFMAPDKEVVMPPVFLCRGDSDRHVGIDLRPARLGPVAGVQGRAARHPGRRKGGQEERTDRC